MFGTTIRQSDVAVNEPTVDNVVVGSCLLQVVVDKVNSYHSSRQLDFAIDSAAAPAMEPIREASREVSRGTTLTEKELFGQETSMTDAEVAEVPEPGVSASADDRGGPSDGLATMSTERSRDFVYVDDEKAAEVAMRSAWSLEQMERRRAQAEAIIAEMPPPKADVADASIETSANFLDQAAEALNNYATTIAIRSSVDDLPHSESAIRASATLLVNVLDRIVAEELIQLPTSSSESSKFGARQLQLATVIVGGVLRAAARGEMPASDRPWLTPKTLKAAIMLVDDVHSTAAVCVGSGSDAAQRCRMVCVWTPSAVRAARRIVLAVTDDAARQASMVKERFKSRTRTPDNFHQDQRALEDEAAAPTMRQPTEPEAVAKSFVPAPTDFDVNVNSSNNNNNNNENSINDDRMPLESTKVPPHPPTPADQRPEAAAAATTTTTTTTTEDNDNTNSRADARRVSGGRLRQLFGLRRREL